MARSRRLRARKPTPTLPTVLLLEASAGTGIPRAALVVPGRLPILFASLPLALAASRAVAVQ